MKEMKWLEIIELRTGSYDRQALEYYLNGLCHDLESDPNHPSFRIYENSDLESDLSIHLFHVTNKPGQKQSPLGYHIASMLRTFGLVSHTTWVERMINQEKPKNPIENE